MRCGQVSHSPGPFSLHPVRYSIVVSVDAVYVLSDAGWDEVLIQGSRERLRRRVYSSLRFSNNASKGTVLVPSYVPLYPSLPALV